MERDFSADGLVELPKLNVDSGLALWQALRAGATASKLPRALQKAWRGVETAGTVLFRAAQARLGDNSRPSADKRKADTMVDNAVGALDEFLYVWTRLPGTDEAQLATTIRQALFPEGTAFLKLAFEEEWAQIELRVTLLLSAGLDRQIAKLGGTPFVAHLQEAHRAYGRALELTAPPSVPGDPVQLREPLRTLSSALRLYVIKVIAHRDEDEPATIELSERLLRPLVTWSSKDARPGGGSASAPSSPVSDAGGAPAAM